MLVGTKDLVLMFASLVKRWGVIEVTWFVGLRVLQLTKRSATRCGTWVSLSNFTVLVTFGNELYSLGVQRVGVVLVRWVVGLAQCDPSCPFGNIGFSACGSLTGWFDR